MTTLRPVSIEHIDFTNDEALLVIGGKVPAVTRIDFTDEEVEPIVVDLHHLQEDLQRFAQLFGDAPPVRAVTSISPNASPQPIPHSHLSEKIFEQPPLFLLVYDEVRESPQIVVTVPTPVISPGESMVTLSLEFFLDSAIISSMVPSLKENHTPVHQRHAFVSTVLADQGLPVDRRLRLSVAVPAGESTTHRHRGYAPEKNVISSDRFSIPSEQGSIKHRFVFSSEARQGGFRGVSDAGVEKKSTVLPQATLNHVMPHHHQRGIFFARIVEGNVPFQFSVVLPGVTIPMLRSSLMTEADGDSSDHDRVLPPNEEEASHGQADAQSGHHSHHQHDEHG